MEVGRSKRLSVPPPKGSRESSQLAHISERAGIEIPQQGTRESATLDDGGRIFDMELTVNMTGKRLVSA